MALSRRIQFLKDTAPFEQLRSLARQRKTSVAELVRCAVREFYFNAPANRKLLVDAILGLKLPYVAWRKAKKDIEAAHAGLCLREP